MAAALVCANLYGNGQEIVWQLRRMRERRGKERKGARGCGGGLKLEQKIKVLRIN